MVAHPNVMSLAPTSNLTQEQDTQLNSGLALWVQTLPRNPLPINRDIAEQISVLLGSEECDSEALAILIKQDPILCLQLFKQTHSALQGRDGNIQHLVHLIGLIGINRLESIINDCKQKKLLAEGHREILAASLLAASLSTTLLAKKHGSKGERFFMPTLFFNAPLWMMWLTAPKIMAQAQTLASKEKQPYLKLSMEKLGFHLPDLLAQAHQLTTLPELTLKALAIDPSKNIPFWAKAHFLSGSQRRQWLENNKLDRQSFYSIEMGIYLLNHYSMAIYFDWTDKHIRRYETLLCHYLGVDESRLKQGVTTCAQDIILPSQLQGLLSPIERLQKQHRQTSTASV